MVYVPIHRGAGHAELDRNVVDAIGGLHRRLRLGQLRVRQRGDGVFCFRRRPAGFGSRHVYENTD